MLRSILAGALPIGVVMVIQALLGRAGAPTAAAWFHLAIVAAAWLGGWRSGLLALVVSFGLAERFLFEASLFDGLSGRAIGRAAVFLAVGLIALTVGAAVHAARRRAAANARTAERLTQELRRTAERLEQAALQNRQLQEVTAAMLRAFTPAQVTLAILDEAAAATGAAMSVVMLPGENGLEVAGAEGCPDALLRALRSGSPEVDRRFRESGGEPAWLQGLPLLPGSPTAPNGGESWAVLPLLVRDRPLGALALGFPGGPPFTEEDRAFMLQVAQECAKALERARLYSAERSARVQAQFAERQIGFLAAAGARLAATLDISRSLADVAELTVSNLGDFCAIHVLEDDIRPRLVAGAMAVGASVMHFGGDEGRYPVDGGADVFYPAVLRSGRGELLPEIDDALLQRAGRTGEQTAKLRELGLVTQLAVPLKARDRVLGTITIGSTEAGRRFSYAELVLAEELAARVAQALDTAMLYQSALQASRAKSSFLAVMSHELRTPLNAILGYSDLILLGVPAEIEPGTRHQVERIRTAAGRLLQLVDDVLNLARVESGKERVRIGPVTLDEIVTEAVEMIRPLATEAALTLHVDCPPGVVLHTDAGKVLQILNNLLANAVKFTPRGRVGIVAQTRAAVVLIDVADTGIGIPPEHLSRIFDPFWQVEQTPTRRYGGTGIGLGVARHLARLLGGDLMVSSAGGKGSTFTLELPLRYEMIPPAR
jgi:signal transduction histidine kinase